MKLYIQAFKKKKIVGHKGSRKVINFANRLNQVKYWSLSEVAINHLKIELVA